ncbi:uncharacterized protein K489DRAFT_378918 [Dissoconium aciculare CBS 342.82]|jgi:hypothetical protein|uniref:Uncharacterized protein n=1 Tax=Dissoconium aciculare CBS 342.82 TaxID=1314786 RepID=A0A6J3M9G6_9PEZI|nr:uncharacterized protein K489DRAFT_378918 [Dissoconium aciculare CBS 342.82]KAF1824498.1 hypothetical protein K489DRAFT_378918 [Dissoconium aciculare CBS 342.82]
MKLTSVLLFATTALSLPTSRPETPKPHWPTVSSDWGSLRHVAPNGLLEADSDDLRRSVAAVLEAREPPEAFDGVCPARGWDCSCWLHPWSNSCNWD